MSSPTCACPRVGARACAESRYAVPVPRLLARHARVCEARQRVLVDWLRLPGSRRPLVPAAPPRAARSADLDRVLREQGAPGRAGKGTRTSRWAVAWDLATAEAEARIDGRWSEATGARIDADGAAVRAGMEATVATMGGAT